MTDRLQSDPILHNILRVLESIEAKLEGYDERVKRLEDGSQSSALLHKEAGLNDAVRASDGSTTVEYAKDEKQSAEDLKPTVKVPYGDWSVDRFISALPQDIYNEWGSNNTHMDRFYSLTTLSAALERRLGCGWSMPDDNRMPLKFFKSNVLKTNMSGGGPTVDTFSKAKQRIERDLNHLCDFDDTLRKHPGNDFVVVDFDMSNNSRIYRLGEAAIGPELMVDMNITSNAPWSRVILYQGATTGDSIDPERKRPEQPIPYFTRTDKIIGVWDHLSAHLQLKRRSGPTNPYTSRWIGFHTTFYEIIKTTDSEVKELWKHGPLYDHPLGWQFRKCAFTMYAPASHDTDVDLFSTQPLDGTNLSRSWTLLIMAPNGFYDYHNVVPFAKTYENDPGTSLFSESQIGRFTQPGAELKFIGQALAKISERWADFQAYFDFILDSGNALMHPADHDNLLFDDGAFSRSRKYFWAIDCLSEFDISITDNLTQWEQYRAARVDPLVSRLSELDRRQLVYIERQYGVLQTQRETFRKKLASIKALRDALFTASAVIESRASTRLGENVKLLTFVSIFFLPLSFTTSLWSINDTFSQVVLIYVILIVAAVTYLVMFNINALATGFNALYDTKKKCIVRAMKSDRSETWKRRGQRFEVFRPKHENPEPSEWYIPLYAASHPKVLLGLVRDGSGGSAAGYTSSLPGRGAGLAGLFRRQRPPMEEIGRTDEGWVL